MKKILIVEDEQIIAHDIQSLLETAGYDIAAITDSSDNVLKLIEDLKPALVLMDIKIRGKVDGIQLTEMIQEKYNIPIIYLTAYTEKLTVERAMRTKPIGYLVKPIFDEELLDLVNNTLK